jgi:serine/threonine-protein kinase RsbW
VSTPDGIPAEVPTRDVVSIRLPASGAYLAVLRTTTASLAARLDFTLDEIEDLRIAVDEASALLIASAVEGADLTSVFEMSADSIHISVSTMTAGGAQGSNGSNSGARSAPARDSFAWTVLSALAGEVDAWTDPDGRQTISLVKHRSRDAAT